MSEPWPDPERFQQEWRDAWNRRLFLDMVEVLDRGLHMPIYIESEDEYGDDSSAEQAHEWVNKAMFDDLVDSKRKIEDQLELLKKCGAAVSAANAARRHLQEQLASPPPPWKTFGQTSTQYDVVFWGDDGTGLPIWEKRVE